MTTRTRNKVTIALLVSGLAGYLWYRHRKRSNKSSSSSSSSSSSTSSNSTFEPTTVANSKRVLILGDGNLSWSLATLRQLRTHYYIHTEHLLITTFDSLDELHERYPNDPIDEIIVELNKGVGSGGTFVQVSHQVDATNLTTSLAKLHEQATTTTDTTPPNQFDLIVFNFPHWGGRGYIQRNRKLLLNFFTSVKKSNILAPQGEIHLALKQGQGGTPVDIDLGTPGNTWKSVEAAATSLYILGDVRPFVPPKGYYCSGRRGTEKSFWLGGALNHVFVHADEEKRPPRVAPAGIYPTKFTFDVSFWILDEKKYEDSDILSICVGGEVDHLLSIQYQSEHWSIPRDALISTSDLRSVVYRITYQSQMGPMSRAMMVEKHDALRLKLGLALHPVILVRGSTTFQEQFLEKMGRRRVQGAAGKK